MNILEVKNLVKRYGKFVAVDHISFSIPKGKVIGFLGPNGAGKTTTIQILSSITLPNGGEITYFGKDFFKEKEYCLQRINFSSAFNTMIGRITAFENLMVFALLYQVKDPKKKIQQLAEYFEMTDLLAESYQNLSAGQKTRVNIIKSLLNDPELLLMDEPTASLDPDIADKTLTLIEKLRKEKDLSILYTSHDMEEVTRICDEVIILDHGKIVAQDTPLELTKRVKTATLKVTFDTGKEIAKKFLQDEVEKFIFLNDHVVTVDTEETHIPKLIFGLSNAGLWLTDIEIKKPTLEDVFLQIARGEKYESA